MALGGLSTLATVFSVGSSVLGFFQQGQQARQQEKLAQQAIDNANAVARAQIQAGQAARKQAEAQAQASREAAALEKEQERKRQRLAIGRQRALAGASGVVLQGSPLDVLEFQASQDALDLLIIEHNGELRATELLNQGAAAVSQANIQAQSTFNQGIAQANQLTSAAQASRQRAVGSLGQAAGTFLSNRGGSSGPVSSFDDANNREIFVFEGGGTTTLPGVKPLRVN